MIFRIIFFILLGYIFIKVFRFVVSIFTSVKAHKQEDRVRETTYSKSKIDKKDVIEAKFEEIETKDDSSSTK